MRRFVGAVLACCVLPVLAVVASEPLQVMSFNIRYDNPRDGLDNWKLRATKVSSLFQKHEVQIAGLQEVQHHQLVWLRQALPKYSFVGVGRDDGKTKGEYAPVAFLKSDFRLVKTETVWLSETPREAGSKGWDAALPRIATFAVLEHRVSGDSLLAGSVHYDHVGAKARKNSGKVIREYVAQMLEKNDLDGVALMGDFNCLPESEPYKEIESGEQLRDAYRLTEKRTGPNSTWSGFRAVVPNRRIDYVFVNKTMSVNSHLIDPQKVNGRFPSDHLPVIVNLSLKD